MTLFHWSKTAASNGTADITCPFPEGMGAPALNDGARGMMAAVAKYRDDIAGAIITGGTSTAYTMSSYEGFGSTSDLSGQMIAFTPHVTNGAGPVRMTIDGLTVFVRSSPNSDLPAGVLIQGTPYSGVYNQTDNTIYLRNLYGNPYSIPLAGCLDYFGGSAPNSAFAFPFGQAISRTTYSALYVLIGNIFGAGDGATTYNLPDCRGRAIFGVDNMGGAGASRLPGGVLSAAAGNFSVNIAQNQLPNVAPAFVGSSGSVSVNTTISNVATFAGTNSVAAGGNPIPIPNNPGVTVTSTGSFTPSGNIASINGGVAQQSVNILPPFIAANKVMRII